LFIDTPSQQPHGPQQKEHNTQTQITKNNKQDTYETNTNNKKRISNNS